MEYGTFKITPREAIKVKNLLKAYERQNDSQYIVFFAKYNDVSISLYSSNKLVLAGKNLDEILKHLNTLEIEQIKQFSFERSKRAVIDDTPILEEKRGFFAAIGSDEVGTGALFGPIVVCATYIDEKINEKLKGYKIMDSKALTDDMILELAPKIFNIVPYSVLSLDNEKFNVMTEKGFNMNKIKALLHNAAFLHLTKKIGKAETAVLDQFCLPKKYFEYLEDEKEIYRNIIFKTKGESYHIAVACGSIIARYQFLKKMDEINALVGFKVNYGAGHQADVDLQRIKDLKGYNFLQNIVKMNFKNLDKLK